jgi:hypothetical protein
MAEKADLRARGQSFGPRIDLKRRHVTVQLDDLGDSRSSVLVAHLGEVAERRAVALAFRLRDPQDVADNRQSSRVKQNSLRHFFPLAHSDHRPAAVARGCRRATQQCSTAAWWHGPIGRSCCFSHGGGSERGMGIWHRLSVLLVCLCAFPGAGKSAVDRIEILDRQLFASGKLFAAAGAYEKLRGRAYFSLDPTLSANAPIADLKLAQRDADGLVRFTSEFLILRPADPAKANGTLLYEVNNRGGIGILAQVDEAPATNDPATAADAGNGFLFEQGFTLVWSAWTWDVAAAPQDHRFILEPPIATDHGKPIAGNVAYELIVNAPTEVASFTGIMGLAYPLARDDAALSERERPEAVPSPIPRQRWAFVPTENGSAPSEIKLEGDFQPGHIYQLTYTARDPRINAAGLAGIRDLLAYLRDNPVVGAAPPKHRLIFGISQSGRVITTMLLRGLQADEGGKPVFDGAFIHVAGGGKGGFDYRFSMPTRHASMLEDHIYATDFFPFTTTTERDPVTGRTASLLDQARRPNVVPKLFFVNNSSEYWNRAASLVHTDPEGAADVAEAAEARVYLIAGAQHYVGRQRDRGIYANCVDNLNHYRVMRALILALDRWVRDGAEPPPSTHPHIADGTLISVEAYTSLFPKIPGLVLPESNLRPPRLEFGDRFETERIADIVPPRQGKPFETRVPAPDADGLDREGIMLPEMLVPLGTRTGFNTRAKAAGFPWATARWDGSFLPFARTESERRAADDPRPSLEARYGTRAAYERKIRAAAAKTVAAGFLRPEEIDQLASEAGDFFDRIMAHDPSDRSCRYMFPAP